MVPGQIPYKKIPDKNLRLIMIKRSVILNILYAFIVVAYVTGSCSGRKNKAEHRDIIPDRDLVSILTDAYLADGLLTLPGLFYKYSRNDTLTSYLDIIENHGYTKVQMDRTMRFYFVRKPKKLIRIYDQVLGRVSEMDSRIDRELPGFRMSGMNIWPGKLHYLYPGPAIRDSASFDFPINYYGMLDLKFTITVFPDDQSVKPQLGLYFSKSDTSGNEQRIYYSTLPFLKDGQPHTYKISVFQNLQAPVRLKGWFIDEEGKAPYIEKHYMVNNIVLSGNLVE